MSSVVAIPAILCVRGTSHSMNTYAVVVHVEYGERRSNILLT